MRLRRLAASDVRNLREIALDTDAPYVVFHGQNAQGKTNALEAIYLLATLKPLRARRSDELVRFGAVRAQISAEVDHLDQRRSYLVEIGEGRRNVQVDGKVVHDLSEYFRGIRAIAFTPSDVGVATGEPARRRNWVDRAAFTAAPAHLEIVRAWKRVLDQKSAALRAPTVDDRVLDALDDAFAEHSARLVDRRVRLLDELSPHVRALHAVMAPGGGDLGLRYRTALSGTEVRDRADRFREALGRTRARERERRMALIGPQSDDVEMTLDGKPVRVFGSQGQVRSTVLSLKLAELVAAEQRGDRPLFLIDDVGSELDHQRKQRLVSILHDIGTQVFASTTDPDHLRELPSGEVRWVRVQEGEMHVGETHVGEMQRGAP